MTDSGIKKKIKNEENSTSKQINPVMQVKTPSLPIKTEFTYKESEKSHLCLMKDICKVAQWDWFLV